MNLDPAKLLVILVVAFMVLGPERLPRVARQLGAAWRELTRMHEDLREEVRSAFPVEEVRSAFPVEDLPHVPRPSRMISGFVSEVTGAMSLKPTPSRSSPSSRRDGEEPGESSGSEPAVGPATVAGEVGPGDFVLAPDDPSLN